MISTTYKWGCYLFPASVFSCEITWLCYKSFKLSRKNSRSDNTQCASVTQEGPQRHLSVPGGFWSPAGGPRSWRGGSALAGCWQRSGATEIGTPLLWRDERPVAWGPESGLHTGLWATREPAAGRGNLEEPDPTLPGGAAHAGAGQRGEWNT